MKKVQLLIDITASATIKLPNGGTAQTNKHFSKGEVLLLERIQDVTEGSTKGSVVLYFRFNDVTYNSLQKDISVMKEYTEDVIAPTVKDNSKGAYVQPKKPQIGADVFSPKPKDSPSNTTTEAKPKDSPSGAVAPTKTSLTKLQWGGIGIGSLVLVVGIIMVIKKVRAK